MAREHALVIGGTGPTGPFVVEGLAARGYDVTILHGGQHEVEFACPGVQHIHEDPHFLEPLQRGVGGRTFDLVVAQYGRLRIIADFFKGKTARLIALGGATGIFAGESDPRWGRAGRPAQFLDTSMIYVNSPEDNKLGFRMVESLNVLFGAHAAGGYSATYVGFPLGYGPRQPGPQEWAVVRRVLDRRRVMVIADGGIKLESRVHSENAAHAVLLAVDNPEIAAGKRYSVADEYVLSMRQRIEYVTSYLDHAIELVDMPYELAWPAHPLWRHERGHRLCQSTLIRAELGYREQVSTESAMARTVDWLLANRPERGGEAERQIGDPFDYTREDELIAAWGAARTSMGEVKAPAGQIVHQYRHPKQPGEQWAAPTVR
jgi:nucleoside-diphosphate-sugar epimerase